MALTITNPAGSNPSAHDSIFYVALSTNNATVNFKYVFDLTVSGNVVASLRNYPDLGGYGIIDIAPIVRSYLTSGFKPSGSTMLQSAGSFLFIDYIIKFQEQLGNGSPVFLGDNVSAKAWNYSLDPYRNSISNFANKFLTTRDRTAGEVLDGEKFFITYFNTNLSAVTATVQKINEDGSNSGSPSTGATISSLSSLLLDLSPYAINSYLGSSFITASTYGYKVSIGSDSITIKQVCPTRFKVVNLIFQNQFGGYDSYKFRLLSREQRNFKRTTYQANDYERIGSAMTFKNSFGVHYGGVQGLSTQIDYSYLITSDYISDIDYKLGAELLASNEVYLHITSSGGEDYYPIVMKDTNYSEKVNTADKLFNYQIQFDLSAKQFSQFR